MTFFPHKPKMLLKRFISLIRSTSPRYFGIEPPASIGLEVNYSCDARCIVCRLWKPDYDQNKTGKKKRLSKDEVINLIKELSNSGVRSLWFVGGNPFLRKELLDFIEVAKSFDFNCGTFTNGSIARQNNFEGTVEKIVLSRLNRLVISLDGPSKEINDPIRGLDGYFDSIVSTIRLLNDTKKKLGFSDPLLSLNCTVSSANFDHLADMIDLACDLCVPEINFWHASTPSEEVAVKSNKKMGMDLVGEHNYLNLPESLRLTPCQIANLERMVGEIRKRAYGRIKVEMDPVLSKVNSVLLEQGRFPVSHCRIPWRNAVISPVGDVYLCSMFSGRSIGNIRDQSFDQIWRGEIASRVRHKLIEVGLPLICQYCCDTHENPPSLFSLARSYITK